MKTTNKDFSSNPHYFTHVESLAIPRKDRVLADKWRIPQGQLKPPPNSFEASVAADDTPPHENVWHGECFPAHAYPRTAAAQTCAYNQNVQQPSTKRIITSRSAKKRV